MISEKMGVINGGIKWQNGKYVEYNSMGPLAEFIAKNVVAKMVPFISKYKENPPKDKQLLFTVAENAIKRLNGYKSCCDIKSLPIYVEPMDYARAEFLSDEKCLVFEYFYIKDLLEDYPDPNAVVSDLIPITMHELTHLINDKTNDGSAVVNRAENQFVYLMTYLFTPTEMNARISECWSYLTDCPYDAVKERYASDSEIASFALSFIKDVSQYGLMLEIIKKISSSPSQNVSPYNSGNVLISVLKLVGGRTLGKIKFPSLSDIFGVKGDNDVFIDEDDGERYDYFNCMKFKFNDFDNGKISRKQAQSAFNKVKQDVILQLETVASHFYRRLCKMIYMWIDEHKTNGNKAYQVSYSLNENDIKYIIHESLVRIFKNNNYLLRKYNYESEN